MHPQHVRRRAGLASAAAAAAAAAECICSCTLLVRRQHRNLLRHSEHLPGSSGEPIAVAATAAVSSSSASSASASVWLSVRERLQHEQNRLSDLVAAAVSGLSSCFAGWPAATSSGGRLAPARRQRRQQLVLPSFVHGQHSRLKHGVQHLRQPQQPSGFVLVAPLCVESASAPDVSDLTSGPR